MFNHVWIRESHEKKLFLPGVYTKNLTLRELIERVADPDRPVQNSEVLNLIVKYFFAFIIHGTEDYPISEEAVYDLIGVSHSADLSRFSWVKLQSGVTQAWVNMYECGYAVSMLRDFSATLEIFLDIINRTDIHDVSWNREYNGIDFGTGTGILLLAQYIQARRNRLIPNKNIGIDIIPAHTKRANEMGESLWFWTVIESDIMDIRVRRFFPSSIHFISNENLPHPIHTLKRRSGLKDDYIFEPFFESIKCFAGHVWYDVAWDIPMFPRAVIWRNQKHRLYPYFRTSQELYWIGEIRARETKDWDTFYLNTSIPAIFINKQITPLEMVWDRFERLPGVRSRVSRILGGGRENLMYPPEWLVRRWMR
jgi:hypothetical protein